MKNPLARKILSLSWLLVAGGALSACKMELRGVPLVSGAPDAGHKHDADQEVDSGHDMKGTDAGHAADASGHGDGDGDSGEGTLDGGGLPVYSFDFDQKDGPLDAPWQAELGSAQVWGQRLCIQPGAIAELPLTPGRYGYLRVDAPEQLGLELAGVGDDGELFVMTWSEAAGQPEVVLSGHELARQAPYSVLRYELEPDYDQHVLRVQTTGGAMPGDRRVAMGKSSQLSALVFRNPAAATSVVCVDNIHVAGARPAQDPFAMALPVNACVPVSGDAAGRCISEHCCKETSAWHEENCGAGCPVDAELCAARCIIDHPSHSVADCTDLCRYAVFAREEQGQALRECADHYCSSAPTQPTMQPLAPTLLESLPPATASSKRLKIELAASSESPAQLVELDLLSNERTVRASFEHLADDVINLYTEPSHSRAVALARPYNPTVNGRVYTWNAAAADPVMHELRLPAPVLEIVPSATLRYLWVTTTPHGFGDLDTYLFEDGKALFHATSSGAEKLGFGPGDRYAYFATGYVATIIDFVAGRSTQFTYSSQESGSPYMRFEGSILWLTCHYGTPLAWVWDDLQGQPVTDTLPPIPGDCTDHQGLLAAGDALYRTGNSTPQRVGALPRDFDAQRWSVPFATATRSLYFVGDDSFSLERPWSLLMVDPTGAVLARLGTLNATWVDDALTPDASRVLPFDGDHGLVLVTRQGSPQYVLGIESYRFDSGAFTLQDLGQLPLIPSYDLHISTRPDSPITVLTGPDAVLGVYDALAGSVLPHVANEELPLSAWAEYPQVTPYRE